MAIFKPSNLSPNFTEVDVTHEFDIKFEAHTQGSNISAYELKIYKEFNVEDDEDGEKSIIYTQQENFKDPENPSNNITYTNGDTVIIHVPSSGTTRLSNEYNYRWSIRVYQDTINTSPSSGDYVSNLTAITSNSIVPTYVGEGMIAGSTRDVIWAPGQRYEMKINNYVECRFIPQNSDIDIFKPDTNTGVRPTYISYSSNDVLNTSISAIYGGSSTTPIKCLKLDTTYIDTKKFDQLTDKQHYLVMSADSSKLQMDSKGTFSSDVYTAQIQDIFKYGESFYFVPYNQTFIRNEDRFKSFYQNIWQPGTNQTAYYTIECRQRSQITDMYKNVGEQNLTELLVDTPFEHSYKDVEYIKQGAGIYNSPGLQSELVDDKNETKDKNVIVKTIYIKSNLRGSGVLTPTDGTAGDNIQGGWILSGAEDAVYGSLNVINPINCFIKFGNYTDNQRQTYNNQGGIVSNGWIANDHPGEIIHNPIDPSSALNSNFSFYISVTSNGTSYTWQQYNQCTKDQITGTSNVAPQFFNVQAYNLSDGQLVIKVPESFYVNTDQFYTLYYVTNPADTNQSGHAYCLGSGFIGGGNTDGSTPTTKTPIRPAYRPFSIKGYSSAPTTSGSYYYYDLFLSPNNGLKPDKYRPVYTEIQNDYAKVQGLIINEDTYNHDKTVDKLDKTQYLCRFLTRTSSGDDAVKQGIFEPQTKVKIYTQFVDSVPQQYFYARTPLLYNIEFQGQQLSGSSTITNRDGEFQAIQQTGNSTSNQIKYFRYQIYQSDSGELLYDSENIYNNSLKYMVRGLPNNTNIDIKFSYEDSLGLLRTEEINGVFVEYGEGISSSLIDVEYDCNLHANKVFLGPYQSSLKPTDGQNWTLEGNGIAMGKNGNNSALFYTYNDGDMIIPEDSTIFIQARLKQSSDFSYYITCTDSSQNPVQYELAKNNDGFSWGRGGREAGSATATFDENNYLLYDIYLTTGSSATIAVNSPPE